MTDYNHIEIPRMNMKSSIFAELVKRIKELEEENKQLKELLQECRPYIALYTENNKHIGFTPETANLLQRIKEVLNDQRL